MSNLRIASIFIVGVCFMVVAMILAFVQLQVLSAVVVTAGFLLFLCWGALDARSSK